MWTKSLTRQTFKCWRCSAFFNATNFTFMMFNLIRHYCWPNILIIRKCKKISNPNYYCCHKTLHFSPSPSQIRTQQLKNFMRQKLTKIGSLELKKKNYVHISQWNLLSYITILYITIISKYLHTKVSSHKSIFVNVL